MPEHLVKQQELTEEAEELLGRLTALHAKASAFRDETNRGGRIWKHMVNLNNSIGKARTALEGLYNTRLY